MVSRTVRISILLGLDIVFFLVELIVGYAVGSLALVADSFHMLNDVISLIIALYAIKLTARDSQGRDERYSYGFHRAEILAALVNGVFLLALCFSISLEALQRFFSTPEVSNPMLVVIVGSLGLLSNIVGLFLFHEHGHSHAPPSHSPSATPLGPSRDQSGTATPTQKVVVPSVKTHRPSFSFSRSSDSFSSLYGHPAATRANLVQTATDMAQASQSQSIKEANMPVPSAGDENDAVPLSPVSPTLGFESETSPLFPSHGADDHQHDSPPAHSHAHGSMNMRAVLLHVMGDALGNVGVIATGLIIWLTTWSFKYYFDPIISLVITVIIFSSALPLVRSASFILLQGVPPGINLDEIRQKLLEVDGVLSVHELHIWQLSETKLVASAHVHISREHDFMPVAALLNESLHHYGIHSSTIQPEWPVWVDKAGVSNRSYVSTSPEPVCLIPCPADQTCDPFENACCPPPLPPTV